MNLLPPPARSDGPRDLYDRLGISNMASADEIRAAHRRRVREHHPDLGGDRAAYEAIQHAYEVLSDPERRKLYDGLGIDQDPMAAEETMRANLRKLLSEAFEAALATLDEVHDDLAQETVAFLDHSRGPHASALERARTNLTKLDEMLSRLSHTGSGPDTWTPLIRTRRQALLTEVFNTEKTLECFDRAIRIVEGYSYEVEMKADPIVVAPWTTSRYQFVRLKPQD